MRSIWKKPIFRRRIVRRADLNLLQAIPSDDPSVPESPAGGSGGGSGRPGTNGWDSSSAAGISDFPADLEQVYYPDYLPEGYRRAYVSAGECVEIIFENSESQNLMTLQYYPKGFDFYEAAAKMERIFRSTAARRFYITAILSISEPDRQFCTGTAERLPYAFSARRGVSATANFYAWRRVSR